MIIAAALRPARHFGLAGTRGACATGTCPDRSYSSASADRDFKMPKNPGTTASNKADGSVVFPELIYQEVGTYKYTVSEVKGNAENVTYDTSVKAVTVTVTDDGKGSLSAKAEPADVTFNNVFTPKQTPADTPRTGDDSRIALYGVLAILSLMGIVGCAIVGRRHADR